MYDTENLNKIIKDNNIKNIIWNGPVGIYENGFSEGSRQIYNFIKLNNGLHSVVGGGDTLSFLEKENRNFEKDFSYVSLSGGAMLTFLAEGTLPVLETIQI